MSDHQRGDAGGPVAGSRRRRAAHVAVLIAAAAAVLAGCGSSHPTHHRSGSTAGTYGALPTFLPTSSIQPDSVLVGDAVRPALTIEGDAVDVHLTRGAVRVVVSGPVVPGEGLPVQTADTTCTWTVTLSRASVRVPIAAADFTAVDHLGTVFHTAPVAGRPMPTSIAPGATVRFELRAVMPTGEGLMRWAPGGDILGSWDFTVEND